MSEKYTKKIAIAYGFGTITGFFAALLATYGIFAVQYLPWYASSIYFMVLALFIGFVFPKVVIWLGRTMAGED